MRILLALLAGAVLGVAPRPAAACSCVDGSLVQLPARDARDVPLNARVFAGDGVLPYEEMQPPPELVGPDGRVPVAAERLSLSVGFVHVLTPLAPLRADTVYEVRPAAGGPWQFTTGTLADEEAPPAPRLEQVDAAYEGPHGNSCGESSHVVLAAESEGDLVLLDVDGGARLAGLGGEVSDAREPGEIWVGTGACLTSTDAGPGAAITVRAASLDLAGNLSAWSAPLETQLPSGCLGCASQGGEAGLGGALLLVALVRKRRIGLGDPP